MSQVNKVRVIPAAPKHNTYEALFERKKRVCAYARVSTNKEEQVTSFESQKRYYTNYIQENPEWEFAGIYADEGISGRSMKKRGEFRRMVQDALDGKIDMIMVKSVSRFARCVVDVLTIVDELRQKGVPVIFEKEHLNSIEDDKRTNFMITLYASIAQEESDSLSDSVNWGIQRRNEQGIVRGVRIYGYDMTEDKKYIVNPEQAEVVRLIFSLYLSGLSSKGVANELKKRGIKTYKGFDNWDESTILYMLKNEKYLGNALLQKTILEPWRAKRRTAYADKQMYLVEDNHEAIIDKDTYNRVQRELEFRKTIRSYTKTGRGGYSSLYPFSCKVFCYQCGSVFRRHNYHSAGKTIPTWVCVNHENNGNAVCSQKPIREDELKQAFMRVVNALVADKKAMLRKIQESIEETVGKGDLSGRIEELDKQIQEKQRELVTMMNRARNANEIIMNEGAQNAIMAEIEKLTEQKRHYENTTVENERNSGRVETLIDLAERKVQMTEFNDTLCRALLEKAVVDGKEVTFMLGGGLEIAETLN